MSFFKELKRRNVVKVAMAYIVTAWVLAQVAEFAVDNFGAPAWVLQVFVVFLILGLPIALIFTWAFELTPDGFRRERDIDRGQLETAQSSRRLDFVIIAVLAIAVTVFAVDEFVFDRPADAPRTTSIGERQRIAVLPFENFSDDSDHFSDGLTEELMNVLAQNPDLWVAGRTSSFAFKGQTSNFREIGDALGVDYVLEGSVRRSGETLRITAQLIEIVEGGHLWSATYDREMNDIFEVQDAVSNAIATELKARLMPPSKRLTDNVQAFALYLEAVAIASSDATISETIAKVDQALALDPTFAKAYEFKAMTYWYTGVTEQDSEDARKVVYQAAKRAIELDPSLVLARPFLAAGPGGMHWRDYFVVMDEAVAEEPENFSLLGVYIWDLKQTGYFEEALQIANRMMAIEPLFADGYDHAMSILWALGRLDEAKSFAESRMANYPWNKSYYLARIYAREQQFDLAIEHMESWFGFEGRDPELAKILVNGFLESNDGKLFLDRFVSQEIAAAATPYDRLLAYTWYLFFGFIDEYWEIAKGMENDTLGPWRRGYELVHEGTLQGGTAFRSHPYFITPEKIELWESRGAPDTCSKETGEWVCW
jgi:TolB-like protein